MKTLKKIIRQLASIDPLWFVLLGAATNNHAVMWVGFLCVLTEKTK